MVKNIASRTPLFLRVVCLYVFAATSLWVGAYVGQAPAAAMPAQHMAAAQPLRVPVQKETISGHPSRLTIARLGIDLPVIDGSYSAGDNSWTLSNTAVQYATITALPNDTQGHTFLYGHNTIPVLEPTKDIQVGDILTIATAEGRTFTYKYANDTSVTPDNTEVLAKTSATPQVTLMTCEGLFSATRRLMNFTYVGVS